MAHADVILYNALKVITEDPVIRTYLERNDPKALLQAKEGIRCFDEENAEPNPEWVVDLYIPFTCVPEGAESDVEAEALAIDTFVAEGLYERLLEALEGTVFTRSDSKWRTEVGC